MLKCSVAATVALVALGGAAFGAERVGSTVSAEQTVKGEGAVGTRIIATLDPIYRDEKLRSNLTGLGQFKLSDGTKVVLGRNAQIVVDHYILGDGGKAKAVSLRIVADRCVSSPAEPEKGLCDQHAARDDRGARDGNRSGPSTRARPICCC